MDRTGYDIFWLAEHHFQREGYECFPNLIQLSLWLATQTRRLKIGCAFNVLPMWHPIRIAEDYAMLHFPMALGDPDAFWQDAVLRFTGDPNATLQTWLVTPMAVPSAATTGGRAL